MAEPRIASVTVTDDEIKASLVDGRTISVPLVWSWRLAGATPAQRQNYESSVVAKACIGQMLTKILAQ